MIEHTATHGAKRQYVRVVHVAVKQMPCRPTCCTHLLLVSTHLSCFTLSNHHATALLSISRAVVRTSHQVMVNEMFTTGITNSGNGWVRKTETSLCSVSNCCWHAHAWLRTGRMYDHTRAVPLMNGGMGDATFERADELE